MKTGREKLKSLDKNLPQCHFIHHKLDIYYPEIVQWQG
jgi:hypothetical protein